MFGGQQWGFGVEVRFRTKKLKKQYEQSGEATKAYGQEVGRRYIGRIDIIKQALDINELCSARTKTRIFCSDQGRRTF